LLLCLSVFPSYFYATMRQHRRSILPYSCHLTLYENPAPPTTEVYIPIGLQYSDQNGLYLLEPARLRPPPSIAMKSQRQKKCIVVVGAVGYPTVVFRRSK